MFVLNTHNFKLFIMSFNLEIIEVILYFVYLLIAYLLWDSILKNNFVSSKDYISKTNNYFTIFMFIMPLIIFINNITFKQITLRDIILVQYPIIIFIYLITFLFFKSNSNKKK